MNIKTFMYDVRGYFDGLAAKMDADYAAWHTATSPASVDEIDMTISNDMLIVTIRWTAT